MTTQAQDVALSHSHVLAILEDTCEAGDAAGEGGECFYCTGPETD